MKAGSIVVCIDDDFDERAFRILDQMPVKGNLYVVRRVVHDRPFIHPEIPGILLEEIVNSKRWFWSDRHMKDYLLEPRFFPWRFREVQPPMEVSYLVEEMEQA